MKLSVINQENIKYLDNLFKQVGISAHHTDFSLLTGGDVSFDYLVSKCKNANADYWTDIQNENNLPLIINSFGESEVAFIEQKNIGIRLVLKYSDIVDYITDEKIITDTISEVSLGNYPKDVCDRDIGTKLEMLYRTDNLSVTSKNYLINKEIIQKIGFVPTNLIEYSYCGECYVRVISNNLHPNLRLSNDLLSNNGNFYWVKVMPLVWLVDKQEDVMITRDVILSGIPYRLNKKIYDNEENFLNLFVGNRLIEDILYNDLKQVSVKNKKMIKRV